MIKDDTHLGINPLSRVYLDNAMVWFILLFVFVLVLSASPLLGSFNVRWSLEIIIGLFIAFFVVSWIILISYPLWG
jgi:hypothetical protein